MVKLIINNIKMFGNYTEQQINLLNAELKKPKDKQKYILGIETSNIYKLEVVV